MKKIIFVTVGTGKFDALIRSLDKAATTLNEKIIMQIGNGSYTPKNCKFFRYDPNLSKFYDQAWLVVSHGGAGSTYELLKRRMKLVSAANLDRTDSHQEDILRALSEKDHLIWCKDLATIDATVKKAKNFKFKKYLPPECTMHEEIERFVESI